MAVASWQFPPKVGCVQPCSQGFPFLPRRGLLTWTAAPPSEHRIERNGLERMQPFQSELQKSETTRIIIFSSIYTVKQTFVRAWARLCTYRHGFLLIQYPSITFLLCSPAGHPVAHFTRQLGCKQRKLVVTWVPVGEGWGVCPTMPRHATPRNAALFV